MQVADDYSFSRVGQSLEKSRECPIIDSKNLGMSDKCLVVVAKFQEVKPFVVLFYAALSTIAVTLFGWPRVHSKIAELKN